MDRQAYSHQGLPNLQEECKRIWAAIIGPGLTQIDRFYPRINHGQQSTLFGFLDMTIVIPTATGARVPIKLRNLKVKEVKGSFRLDMHAEEGKDGNWYDIFMPKSEALRVVLTTFVGQDAEVQATIAQAAQNKPAQVPASVGASVPATSASEEETHFSGDLYDYEAQGAESSVNNPFQLGAPTQSAAAPSPDGIGSEIAFE